MLCIRKLLEIQVVVMHVMCWIGKLGCMKNSLNERATLLYPSVQFPPCAKSCTSLLLIYDVFGFGVLWFLAMLCHSFFGPRQLHRYKEHQRKGSSSNKLFNLCSIFKTTCSRSQILTFGFADLCRCSNVFLGAL